VAKSKIIIVGSGFSAFIAKILTPYNSLIYALKSTPKIAAMGNFRNSNLEVNKLFSKKSYSYGPFQSKLKKILLHSHNQQGGNTNIWGGFIDSSKLNWRIIQILTQKKINFTRLTLKDTGSISNCKYIFQLQDRKKNIFNAATYINIDKIYYLESFKVYNKRIKLIFYDPEKNEKKIKFTKNLILAVGVVEFLYLLCRSGYIKNYDVLTFSEFKYNLELKIGCISKLRERKASKTLEIRFDLFRALFHFLGIQKNLNFISISKLIPFYVQQRFSLPLRSFSFQFINNTIMDISRSLNDDKFEIHGQSIHYCNLKINNININNFLTNIHPGIVGIGMPFVLQRNPGPICNDIINDAMKKLESSKES
jgi:hypothetical protein